MLDYVAEDCMRGLAGVVFCCRRGGLEVSSDEGGGLLVEACLGDGPLYDLAVCVSVGWGLGLWQI